MVRTREDSVVVSHGHISAGLYAALGLVGLWFCWRFVPETKGVSLEAIEANLRGGLPTRAEVEALL
jgi:transketolase N-terminal domain/subunit